MNHKNQSSNQSSQPVSSAGASDLFTPIDSTVSSQIGGGYWSQQASYFPKPPRNYSYGRLPSASHQLAAQRLNQALFA